MTETTPPAADGHGQRVDPTSLTIGGEPPATPVAALTRAETLHVVQFSGGIGSWATAMRVAENTAPTISSCSPPTPKPKTPIYGVSSPTQARTSELAR